MSPMTGAWCAAPGCPAWRNPWPRPAPPSAPAPFLLTITPDAGGRRLQASAPDAGGLLRVLDITSDLSGGRMTVAARYDDARPTHPLSGTAELHDFRILNAPIIGRVLQAATLYGLIEVLRGPGLGFTDDGGAVPLR